MSSSKNLYANLKSAFLRFILYKVSKRLVRLMHDLPSALVVEETIRSLFVLLGNVLGLLMPLEPRLVLLVEPPALALEGLGSQVLLVSPLTVVEGVEQRVCIDSIVESCIVKDVQRFLRVVCWRVHEGRLWFVMIRSFGIKWRGAREARLIQHPLVNRLQRIRLCFRGFERV